MIKNDGCDFEVLFWNGNVPIDTWDEGFGPLWIMRNSISVDGIVRAETWEEAWECCVDEILSDADQDDIDVVDENGDLREGYHWRGSGTPSNPKLNSPVCSEDLNGQLLELLTPELAEACNIKINWV